MIVQSVYVMRSDLGLVKIGISRNTMSRMRQVMADEGVRVWVEKAFDVEAPYSVEQVAHQLLNKQRRHGEWFEATVDEAVAAIHRAVLLVPEREREDWRYAVSAHRAGVPREIKRPSHPGPWALPEQVQWARELLGLTVVEMAKIAGTPAGTIAGYEAAKEKWPMFIAAILTEEYESVGFDFSHGQVTIDPGKLEAARTGIARYRADFTYLKEIAAGGSGVSRRPMLPARYTGGRKRLLSPAW